MGTEHAFTSDDVEMFGDGPIVPEMVDSRQLAQITTLIWDAEQEIRVLEGDLAAVRANLARFRASRDQLLSAQADSSVPVQGEPNG